MRTLIDWVPLYLEAEFDDIKRLSDEAIAAYVKLRSEYFSVGELPKVDDDLKSVADLDRPKLWPKVRAELQKHVFAEDWNHPVWERMLRTAEERLAKNRARTAPATEARKASAAARRVEARDPDEEPIPF